MKIQISTTKDGRGIRLTHEGVGNLPLAETDQAEEGTQAAPGVEISQSRGAVVAWPRVRSAPIGCCCGTVCARRERGVDSASLRERLNIFHADAAAARHVTVTNDIPCHYSDGYDLGELSSTPSRCSTVTPQADSRQTGKPSHRMRRRRAPASNWSEHTHLGPEWKWRRHAEDKCAMRPALALPRARSAACVVR